MEDCSGFLQKLKFSSGQVTSCDLNANCLLAVGLSDNTVRVLEWKAGLGFVDMSYSPLDFHKFKTTSVRFSPRGTMLAASSLDGTAVLIDVSRGTKIFTMVQHNKSSIKFCEFASDGSRALTAGDDNIACFWDLLRQRQIRHFRFLEDDSTLRSLSLSPDAELLLVMDSADLLKLWFVGDVVSDSARCILLRRGVHSDNHCSAFSPVKGVSGVSCLGVKYGVVTCGGDGSIKVWDLLLERRGFGCDLVLSGVLQQGAFDVTSVRFDASGGHLVSTGLDGLVRVWEVETGKCLKALEGHSGLVTCAAFSRDSRILASGSDVLIVWDLTLDLTLDSQLTAPCNVSCHFTHIDLSNYFVEGTEEDRTQRLGFTLTQKLTSAATISCVRFVSEDVLAVAGGEKAVTLWKRGGQSAMYESKETLQKCKYSVTDVDVSPCGSKIIFCSIDGAVTFWDLNMSLSCEMRSPGGSGSLRAGRFLPDCKFIAAAGDDQEVYLWDANSVEFLRVLQRHEDAVTALAFTPDGKYLASACDGGHVTVQSLEDDRDTCRVNNAHDLGVTSCDFSLGGLSGGECMETVGDVADRRTEIYPTAVKAKCERLYLLATGGKDSLVKLWGAQRSDIFILTALSGHGGTVNSVSFSPSEPFILASCSSDTTVRIWHAKTKQCLHVLDFHKSAVTTCSFSRNSSQLATGSLDKTVLVFNLTKQFCHESREWTSVGNSSTFLENWTKSDVGNWFSEMGWTGAADKLDGLALDGKALLTTEDDSIVKAFGLQSHEEQKALRQQVCWLKKQATSLSSDAQFKGKPIPHMFLCPITHEIMKDPVICSDGFAYDRPALIEWFLTGKFLSPVTKEPLKTTKFLSYSALRVNIYKFLYENKD